MAPNYSRGDLLPACIQRNWGRGMCCCPTSCLNNYEERKRGNQSPRPHAKDEAALKLTTQLARKSLRMLQACPSTRYPSDHRQSRALSRSNLSAALPSAKFLKRRDGFGGRAGARMGMASLCATSLQRRVLVHFS